MNNPRPPGATPRTVLDLRRERRMSQTELAKAIGSEQSYVSKIERGVHTPSAVLLQRIARALNVDANDILIETPPQAVAS